MSPVELPTAAQLIDSNSFTLFTCGGAILSTESLAAINSAAKLVVCLSVQMKFVRPSAISRNGPSGPE